jgi:hypothetical protein
MLSKIERLRESTSERRNFEHRMGASLTLLNCAVRSFV